MYSLPTLECLMIGSIYNLFTTLYADINESQADKDLLDRSIIYADLYRSIKIRLMLLIPMRISFDQF